MKHELENFKKAATELLDAMETLKNEDLRNILDNHYPFARDFYEIRNDICDFAEKSIAGLEDYDFRSFFKAKQGYETPVAYAIATEDFDCNDGTVFENWLYELLLEDEKVTVYEDATGDKFEISFEEVKQNFLIVDEPLYDYTLRKHLEGDAEAATGLINLARKIGKRIGQE